MLLPDALPCSLPLPPAKLPVGYYRDVFINALSSFYDSQSPLFLSTSPPAFPASVSCHARRLFFLFLFSLSLDTFRFWGLRSPFLHLGIIFWLSRFVIWVVFFNTCHHRSNLPHSSRRDRLASMTHFDLLCSPPNLSLQRTPRSHLN